MGTRRFCGKGLQRVDKVDDVIHVIAVGLTVTDLAAVRGEDASGLTHASTDAERSSSATPKAGQTPGNVGLKVEHGSEQLGADFHEVGQLPASICAEGGLFSV